MGLFNLFKKKGTEANIEERQENFPELLLARFFFVDKPIFDKQKVLNELSKFYKSVDSPSEENMFLFFFPEIQVGDENSSIPVQCSVFIPDKDQKIELEPEVFQNNWHWNEAKETVEICNFEFLINDLMTRSLDYKVRHSLFMNFVVALAKATNPQAIYFPSSQKLIEKSDLIETWTGQNKIPLHGLVNVRLFNDNGSAFMDTIGLNSFGLPDFEIKTGKFDENTIAQTLWNCTNYIFEYGDIIETGNTIAGPIENSKCKCTRKVSLLSPSRIVIDMNLE